MTNITKGQLWNYDIQLQTLVNTDHVLAQFHQSDIRIFYKRYRRNIEGMRAAVDRLRKKHMETDEKGELRVATMGDKMLPIFKSGYNAEEQYNNEYASLMSEPVVEIPL